jgi:hypothetical protein
MFELLQQRIMILRPSTCKEGRGVSKLSHQAREEGVMDGVTFRQRDAGEAVRKV